MTDTLRIIAAVAAAPAIAIFYCAYVHWDLSQRLRRLENWRVIIREANQGPRILRSVEFTERQQARATALMTAIGADEPVQLYRRQGSRFVAHGDAA